MNINIRKIVLTSLFIAIGAVLPQIFHMFQLGNVISPMHFPVLICGLLLGAYYGLACGVITPIVTGMIFIKPPLFPVGLAMAIELGIYGLVCGLLNKKFKLIKNDTINVYFSLIIAMLMGRIAATLVNTIYYVNGLSDKNINQYIHILFIVGLPGLLLQIAIIPPIVININKYYIYNLN